VNGLEPVASVRQSARHNDRHGILQEGALHLEIDFDGFDVADDFVASAGVGGGAVGTGHDFLLS